MYLYIISNPDWIYENKYKYGFTNNINNRLNNSHEQHSYLSIYKYIYKIDITDKYILNYQEYDKIISILSRNIDNLYQLKLYYNYDFENLFNISKHLVNHNGSTEFIYESGLEIFEKVLFNDFKILGLNIEKIDNNDLLIINQNIEKEYNNKKTLVKNNNLFNKNINIDNNNDFILRPYQYDIIKFSIEKLKEDKKIYIELATGGGKSLIIYNIIKTLKPNIILMFSPRIIINNQNIKKDYLNILENNYDIIFDITKPIISNTIILICIQSKNKIYEKIKEYNIKNIFIWFDEAHWCIENMAEEEKELSNFYLNDNNYIDYRCFTSASPNKELIKKNKNIFGKLYSPIKIKDLINQKWLSNINPYIYAEKKDYPNIINNILSNFKNNNKKFGFSFHKDCLNACNLFIKHYQLYKENKTDIKPFILVSEYYNLDNIKLDYNYKDIKIFENTEYSLGFVVQQYNMGYDFNNLDYISITDPKLSYSDIIQSIGRGMRPDKLGINGTNLNKCLDILIPVYINDDYKDNKYDKTLEVFRYLLNNIELSYENIKFINFKEYNKNENKELIKQDIYNGIDDVKIKLFNILKDENKLKWNLKKIIKHLKIKNIHNQKEYNEYRKNNDILNLPENLFLEYKDFKWIDTYKEYECPYYDKKECIKNIKKYYNDEILYNYDDEEKIKYLNKIDNKIPNQCLWAFYGGYKNDYFI
jgi:superfamily II DNA or RNA helicase